MTRLFRLGFVCWFNSFCQGTHHGDEPRPLLWWNVVNQASYSVGLW